MHARAWEISVGASNTSVTKKAILRGMVRNPEMDPRVNPTTSYLTLVQLHHRRHPSYNTFCSMCLDASCSAMIMIVLPARTMVLLVKNIGGAERGPRWNTGMQWETQFREQDTFVRNRTVRDGQGEDIITR